MLSDKAMEALHTIDRVGPMMQPKFPPEIEGELLDAGVVRQTLGGTLAITDAGRDIVTPGWQAAIVRRRRERELAAKKAREKKRKEMGR